MRFRKVLSWSFSNAVRVFNVIYVIVITLLKQELKQVGWWWNAISVPYKLRIMSWDSSYLKRTISEVESFRKHFQICFKCQTDITKLFFIDLYLIFKSTARVWFSKYDLTGDVIVWTPTQMTGISLHCRRLKLIKKTETVTLRDPVTDSQPTKTVLCRELQDHACVCSGCVIDLADILTFSTFSYSLVIVNVNEWS